MKQEKIDRDRIRLENIVEWNLQVSYFVYVKYTKYIFTLNYRNRE